MRAVLTSKIPVHLVEVFAEMAWMERRPELGLLCRAARQDGNRIGPPVVQSALPGLSDTGAKNVIAWCRFLGLCDAGGAVTALGEQVAQRDEAPVPEQGVYGLWLANHPVIGRRVLAVERLSSSRAHRNEQMKPLDVAPELGTVFRSVVAPAERFMVRALPTNHGHTEVIERASRATCRLRWRLDFDQGREQWQLDGTIDAPMNDGNALRPIQHEPESTGMDLWKLAETWTTTTFAPFGQWQVRERRLATPFEGLSGSEQDAFRKTLSIRRVEVPGRGVFEDVSLEDVPIGPASAQDAQRWAMARFDRRLSTRPGYRSRAAVREEFALLTEGTPLEAFLPTLPPHDELLAQASRAPERYWSLAAPVDLAPSPVGALELGELRIGAPATAASACPPGVIRIPFHGGWSMRQLVDQLLAGSTPRRVLLSDRYVRGDDNLAGLKLLVATLRASAPTVAVDVWTGDEGTDFKAIQAITGAPTRSYRETFGKNMPHDRYLLVLPGQGAGFGWHMSNSPLHARPDAPGPGPGTPLRWKDLAATRVTAEELEPALRAWLEGGR